MTVATTIEMVRDLLIGADTTIFTDEWIQRQIDQGMYAIDIAIAMADSQASLYASKTDLKVGSISISGSQKAAAWQALKANLILRKNTGAGLPNDGSSSATGLVGIGGGVLTGASISDMEATVANPDAVPSQFEIGQFDNPTSNPTGV